MQEGIRVTPTESQDGIHTFTVEVTDGALVDSEEIIVTVANVNVAQLIFWLSCIW